MKLKLRRLVAAACAVGVGIAIGTAPTVPANAATPPHKPSPVSGKLAPKAHPMALGQAAKTAKTGDLVAGLKAPLISRLSSSVADVVSLGHTGITATRVGTAKTAETLSLLDSATASSLGLPSTSFRLSAGHAALQLRIPNSSLDSAFGADYAARIDWRIKRVGAVSTPAKVIVSDGETTIAVPKSRATDYVIANDLGDAGNGTGSFSAETGELATASGALQRGDFTWDNTFTAPTPPAGPTPKLTAHYDAQSLDGELATVNDQASALGDGWELSGGGSIQRTLIKCSSDSGGTTASKHSSNLCWKSDNATLNLNGSTETLIKDASTGSWHPAPDDGSRIEHLVGTAEGCAPNGTHSTDCWRVTTIDGTQYYFGLNELPGWTTGDATTNSTWTVPVFGNNHGEPCYSANFANAKCTQAWRWNLDYVVDPHGNAEALYYDVQQNRYNTVVDGGATYIASGQLARIDYGFRDGNAYAANAASDRVVVAYSADGRCVSTTHCSAEPASGFPKKPAHPSGYQDVPFDLLCTTGSCGIHKSPTFWTDAMLSSVTTQALVAGSYSDVDSWTLVHTFPEPGDSTSPRLFLLSITRAGHADGQTLTQAPTVFAGSPMANVVTSDPFYDLIHFRIGAVQEPTGAVLGVEYAKPNCTPGNAPAIKKSLSTNTHLCFPEKWSAPYYPLHTSLFYKYVVASTETSPVTGGVEDQSVYNSYSYGSAAWRYSAATKTWSTFAGFNTVDVKKGYQPEDQSTDVHHVYYQGLDGDRLANGKPRTAYVTGSTTDRDSSWLAGRTREVVVLDGPGGAVLSDTVDTPFVAITGTASATSSSRVVRTAQSVKTEALSTGGDRTTTTNSTYSPTNGLPLTVSSETSDAGSTCTVDGYATNTAKWILDAVDAKTVYSLGCSQLSGARYPQDVVSAERFSFDGSDWSVAPTRGDVTTTNRASDYSGDSADDAVWLTTNSSTFDADGRVTSSQDAMGHVTSTEYSPAADAAAGAGPLVTTTVTNPAPFNWTTTTTYDAALEKPITRVDPDGSVTSWTYDAYGRSLGVWEPGEPIATSSPTIKHIYTDSATAASVVVTETLAPYTYVAVYRLYDGLGRIVQVQSSTGFTNSDYNTAGQLERTAGPYWANTSDWGLLFIPYSDEELSSVTDRTYDGDGRILRERNSSIDGILMSTIVHAYPGADRADVSGAGPASSTFTDSRGNVVKTVTYDSSTADATAPRQVTTTSFDAAENPLAQTDPAGVATHWTWNLLGRNTAVDSGDSGLTVNTYDDDGDLVATKDARDTTVSYDRDALGRVVGEYDGSIDHGTLLASWTWDTLDKGYLTSSTSYAGGSDGTHGVAYVSAVSGYDSSHDILGRSVSIPADAPAFGGETFSVAYTYQAPGYVRTVSYPAQGGASAVVQRPSWDAYGDQHSTEVVTGAYIFSVDDPLGRLDEIQRLSQGTGEPEMLSNPDLPNDGNLHPRGYQEFSFVAQTGGPVLTRADTTSVYGPVTASKVTSVGGPNELECFTHDALGDLTSEWTEDASSSTCDGAASSSDIAGTNPFWTDFAVDPATGLRTSVTTHSTSGTDSPSVSHYTYVPGTHHLVSTGEGSYSYDPAGDQTSAPGQTRTFDALGRLASTTTAAANESSVYDADGDLLVRTDSVNGSTLFFGDLQVHVAPGSTAETSALDYRIGDRPVAIVNSDASGATTETWVDVDSVGTPVITEDPTSGALSFPFSDSFGNAVGSQPTWPDLLGYHGGVPSQSTGLTLIDGRDYDPTTGTYLEPAAPGSADPYALPASEVTP